MTEIELKYLLSENEYREISSRYSWEKEKRIENYYYDTSGYDLYCNNITLRVRVIDNQIVLECKQNSIQSKKEKRISQEQSIPITSIPKEIDSNTINQFTGMTFNHVVCIGKLTTYRKTMELSDLRISMDQCSYLGKTDYELEVELEDETACPNLNKILGISNLSFAEGKRTRFIKEKRKKLRMEYLSDNLSEALDRVGGKGWGLNRLLALPKNTCRVPHYTVITVDAFEQHIKNGGFQLELAKEYDCNQRDRLMEHIVYGPISEDITDPINDWFDHAKKPLCVRSSCVAEDGNTTSEAGIYDTFLNITTQGELWRYIRKIWASVFYQDHIEYCNKVGTTLKPMAIVIQELTCAAVSGVVFSDDKSTIIRAAYGMGSGVVDGAVKSDYWEYDKDGCQVYKDIISKKEARIPNVCGGARYAGMDIKYPLIGDFEYTMRVIHPDERHAIFTVELPETLQKEACIDDNTAKMIYDTAKKIKEQLQMENMDMEWCLDHEKNLYILQVRPLVAKLIHYQHNTNQYAAQPISGKVAYGNLCFVNRKEDIEKLDKSKIAVMNWMPESVTSVLMKCSGIIIKTWQNMSHFALLVREWEIPCIAAVEDYVLEEGAYVKINGATGELVYLTDEMTIRKEEELTETIVDGMTNSAQWPIFIYEVLNDRSKMNVDSFDFSERDAIIVNYFREIVQEEDSKKNSIRDE